MSLNPFCTCLFTVLHYTFISQLLSLGASTADLLLWLWFCTRFCDFQALVWLWSRQSQGRGSILQRQSTHCHKSFKNSRCRKEWCWRAKRKKGHQIQSRNKLETLMNHISLVFNQMNEKPLFREITTGLQYKASLFSIQYIVVLVCIHYPHSKHIIMNSWNRMTYAQSLLHTSIHSL